MKKYISFICSLFLFGATSCVDVRYDDIINDSAYFPKSDLQEETLSVMNAEDYVYDIWIHKAGYFQEKFVGKVELDYNFLMEYNIDNGTDYEMLDESFFSFERDFVIEKGVDETAVPLTLKTEKILAEKGYTTVYLPFSVSSLTPGSDIYLEKSRFILALTLQQPILKIDGENVGKATVDFNKVEGSIEYDITAILDIVTTEDLEVTYTVDEACVPYGEHLLTSGYSMNNSVVIPTGSQYVENYLVINPDEIETGRWVLPVRMGTTNTKVKTDKNADLFILTVIKGNIDDEIISNTSDVQANEIIIASDNTNEILVGNIVDGKDFNNYTVEIKNDVSNKFTLNYDSSTGIIKVQANSANDNTDKEITASLIIRSEESLLEKEFTVRQCMKGHGVTLNKQLWNANIITEDVSFNTGTLKQLFDNLWTKDRSEYHYVEIKTDKENPGFTMIIDLGEKPHEYTHLGLLPRLEWVQQSPKTVVVEYSDDKENWTKGYDGDAFTQAELTDDTGKYLGDQWDCKIIKWIGLGNEPISNRYLRVTFGPSWYSSGNLISFDEFFVSDNPTVD